MSTPSRASVAFAILLAACVLAPCVRADNLVDNIWTMVEGALGSGGKSNGGNGNGKGDAMSFGRVVVQTIGNVGDTIADVDPSNTRNKSTTPGLVGFVDNLSQAGAGTLLRTAESALTNITSDRWMQNQIGRAISGSIERSINGGGNQRNRNQTDGGQCEIERNANYVGKLLNNGHETIVSDASKCCQLCQRNPECNAFVYCGKKEGCGTPYYVQGECYLKRQENPAQKQAYERGQHVAWTSGITVKVESRAPRAQQDRNKQQSAAGGGVQSAGARGQPTRRGWPSEKAANARQDSFAPQQNRAAGMDAAKHDGSRDVLYVSGKPVTWIIDDVAYGAGHEEGSEGLQAKAIACGQFNTQPGVASFNRNLDMQIDARGATPGGPVLLLWSRNAGRSTLPRNYLQSGCGELALSIQTDPAIASTDVWDHAVARADEGGKGGREGGEASGTARFTIRGMNGDRCRAFLFQFVDVATCKTSPVYNTKEGL